MRIFSIIICLFGTLNIYGQDIIVLKNGDETRAKIIEIGVDEIKYKKFENPDGPAYVYAREEVFMIKFENGTKEVFNTPVTTKPTGAGTNDPAILYFMRPKKMSASRPEIIVGTVTPDEVILKLKNGRWHRMEYANFGNIDFVFGVYSINPEWLTIDIIPGQTYYFYCEVASQGLKVMASMKQVDQQTAESIIAGLKEQPTSMVK